MAVLSLIPLLLIVILIVVAISRRTSPNRPPASGDGEDLLNHALLAISVGVATFSMMNLGRAAFPTGGFVVDPERQVAGALAGLIVSLPIAVILWRRQQARRQLFPRSGGWTLYLVVVEAVFMTAFAISLNGLLNQLLGQGDRVHLTDILVFAGIIAFHEVAARTTPPQSGGFELPRITGTAIGFGFLVFGSIQLLAVGLENLFGYTSFQTWREPVGVTVTGAVIWAFRWLRSWPQPAGQARNAWTFLIAGLSLGTLVGAVGSLIAGTLVYLATSPSSPRDHFSFAPTALAVAVVAAAMWIHHRRRLGSERTNPVRAYEYLAAAQGLSAAVVGFTGLVAATFTSTLISGSNAEAAIYAAIYLLLGLAVWTIFWRRAEAQPHATEVLAPPRRSYLIGLGVVMAITASIALIITLVGVFQMILGVGGSFNQFSTTIPLTLSAAAATWHLFNRFNRDKSMVDTGVTIAAFDVVLICSHPGMVSTLFPDVARVRVVHRADDVGVIDDDMAEQIVAAVNNRSSFVWVDEDGFRVAPAR